MKEKKCKIRNDFLITRIRNKKKAGENLPELGWSVTSCNKTQTRNLTDVE